MGSGASASAQPSPQSSSSGLASGSSNNPKQQAANNSPRPARANGSSQNNGSQSSEPPPSSRQKERGVRFDEQNHAQNAQERQTDRHRSSTTAPNLSHVMTREKTLIRESEQPKYTDGEEVVLEKFYHRNGSVYNCLYDNGKRFLLNPATGQIHQPFPQRWYKEGFIETNVVVQRKQEPGGTESRMDADMAADNDRSGFLVHPKLGRIATYVAEEKTNVHYYFDKNSGTWIRVPMSWELYSDFAKEKLDIIQEALPDWKERYEVLATLRSCRYDPHETISTYLAYTENDAKHYWKGGAAPSTVDASTPSKGQQPSAELQKEIANLKEKLKITEQQLAKEKEEKESANIMIADLQQRIQEAKTATIPHATNKADQAREQALKKLNTELLRQRHMEVKTDTRKMIKYIGDTIIQIRNSFGEMCRGLGSQDSEVQALRELYRKEALQRKLLYNKLQELRGNIRVICRCRYDKTECHYTFPNEREVAVPGKKNYKFDQVFRPDSTQDQVFQEVMPIILSCVDGYNIAIIAYGQTGSGKTHTMQGTAKDPGINVRAIKELLKLCNEKENVEYTLTASLVEIYNESIYDLLSDNTSQLEIRTNGNKIVLPGAMEYVIGTYEDAEQLMEQGNKNRTVAQTKMNSSSSRSHLIFRLKVEGKDSMSKTTTYGSLTLCDLAGSERVSRSEVKGEQLKEAAAINSSLSSLGQVFTALKGNNLHIPYRNSKLTHMLQPCLGGDAKACMIVTMSPSKDNVTETVSTLEFGSGARQIQLGQAKANVAKAGDNFD